MYRFYLTNWPHELLASGLSDATSDGEAWGVLDVEQAKHARRVLRLSDGDRVELFDGQGHVGVGVLGQGRDVRIERAWQVPAVSPRLTIASAVPKGPRADAMVDQLGQLGVSRFIPMATTRSVVRPRDAKLDRWSRGAIETAKQCGRAWLMEITPMLGFDQVLGMVEQFVSRRGESALHEERESGDASGSENDNGSGGICVMGLPESAGAISPLEVKSAAEIMVMIGPEGGWTDDEIAQAKAIGVQGWTFGPHVMRIETAAVAAAALVRGR